MFGAELPHEEWWKESLTAGSCLAIPALKTGLWEVPAAALLHLRFGGSGGSVSVSPVFELPVQGHVFPEFTGAHAGALINTSCRLCEQCYCQPWCKHSMGEALRALWCFRWLLRVESHPRAPQPRPVGPPAASPRAPACPQPSCLACLHP